MTERKITAGDWLEHSYHGRVRVAGFDEDGDPVFSCDSGTELQCDLMPCFLASTRPLPGCDGWEWVEPAKQDLIAQRIMAAWMRLQGMRDDEIATHKPATVEVELENLEATVRMQEPSESLSTCPDCGEFRGHGHEDVCPMAWVVQDMVPDRLGIDQWRWSNTQTWLESRQTYMSGMHGDKDGDARFEVRCRRKDLPKPIYCPDCNAMVEEKHEDVCPMAWVEITDPEHVFRVGVDQFSCPPTTWTTMRIGHVPGTLGEYKESCGDEIGRCRCRRKDIPVQVTPQSVAEVCESTPDPSSPFGAAMRQPSNRVPVMLWIPANRLPEGFGDLLWSTGDVSEDDIRGLVEVLHDANGFFLEREP